MSSAAGKTPAPGQAVYSASKYALNGYFHSLRSEVCKSYSLSFDQWEATDRDKLHYRI